MDAQILEAEKPQHDPWKLWFAKTRFGMFIHWGLYSIPAIGEWTLLNQAVPFEQYKKLANKFTGSKFNAKEWIRIAKEAGAEYVVFTTRHHDGYCLYDSKISDFTSIKTAAKRDFVAEYVEAAREAGLRVGLYYSLADWRYPTHSHQQLIPENMEFLIKYTHEQVRELLTGYGQIDMLWFDGPFGYDERGITWDIEWPQWDGERLLAMARELQPGIVINDRARIPGDYTTPEQHIKPAEQGRLWEACMTLNENWGYHKGDNRWKPTWQLIDNLVRCASFGGAYLLNIGPKADGTVPAPSVKRMKEIGQWLAAHGEAIYGTQRSDLRQDMVSFKLFTRKGNFVYMFEPCWTGKTSRIRNFDHEVVSATLLKSGRPVKFRQEGDVVEFYDLPARPDDPITSVFKIELKS